MWSKTPQLCPLNSLLAKSIRQYCSNAQQTAEDINGADDVSRLSLLSNNGKLNIHVRQSITDYIIRERIPVSSKFIGHLINDGLYSFDLWALSESNNYPTKDIYKIVTDLSCNMLLMRELTLGGSSWIYNTRVINGPLKTLFNKRLPQLLSLKMQQIASADDLIAIFNSCDNLRKLDICQPSITDRDIIRIESQLRRCNSRKSLKELRLPSSLKAFAIFKLLSIFTNVESLKCAQFEQLLELIDHCGSNSKAKRTVSALRCLVITHPLSCDTIKKIVDMCPLLEEMSLEIQDGMELTPISRLTHLKHLELRNSPTLPASYSEQVLPIFQVKGRDFLSLSMEQFDVIDLTTIARLCPNLESFSVQWFTILGHNNTSTNGHKMVKHPFSNLRYLRLRPRSQRNVPSDACALMLSHATQLIHVELYCCYDLCDSYVKTLHCKNTMTHLRSLILRHGHNVTKDAVNLLVSRANDLTFIDCGYPVKKNDDNGHNDMIGN